MDREASVRPIDKVLASRAPSSISIPKIAAMVSSAARPVTQQGLSGLRPLQTAGGGVNRIYHDKRYWASRIQAQMNKMNEEIARLKKENDEYKMKSINIENLRKTAQRYAKKIEDEQEMLNAYNTALEMHLSKTKEDEIIAETEQLKRANESKLKALENLYNEKVKLQEKVEQEKKELEEEERLKKARIEELSEEDKQKYYALVDENNKVVKGIDKMQNEIKNYKEKIESYKGIINQSPEKQEILQLIQTQHKLESQKEELEGFLQNTLTPTQQREMLIKQVKQDKNDTEALLNLKTVLEEEFATKKERLTEVERELDGKDNARLKKHRELRERGEHMDSFLDSFEEKSTEAKEKLKVSSDQVVLALEHLASNLAELDLEEFTNIPSEAGDSSLESWNKRCTFLLTQAERLKSFKAKYEAEIAALTQKKLNMLAEIEEYKDIDRKHDKLKIQESNLIDEEASVKAKLESTQAAVVEVQRRNNEILKKLEENPEYHKVINLEKDIEEKENKLREMEETLKAELSDYEIVRLTKSVNDLLEARNQQLILSLKNKKKE